MKMQWAQLDFTARKNLLEDYLTNGWLMASRPRSYALSQAYCRLVVIKLFHQKLLSLKE